MASKPTSSLRHSDGSTLMNRFAARQPQALRLVDGGMFNGFKRAIGMGPAETMTEKYARQDAEFAAKQPAAPAAPTAPRAKAISDYAGNSALQRRMEAAGLRDGGDLRTGMGGNVPGTGQGDKIPAKYEPGEFVVSNAMLDAAPQLREQLHDLRGDVLAAQGKTVAEADAKALRGGKLRAAGGAAFTEAEIQAMAKQAQDARAGGAWTPRNPNVAGGRNPILSAEAAKLQSITPNPAVSTAAPAPVTPAHVTPIAAATEAVPEARTGLRGMYDSAKNLFTRSPKPAAPAAESVFSRAGRVASEVGANIAKDRVTGPILRGATALASSPVGKFAGAAGGIRGMLALHHGEAGAPTLDAERVEAMKRPWDPDWKSSTDPTNPGKKLPTVPGLGGDATGPGQVKTEGPRLRTENGRQYLPETVSNEDRLRSDGLIEQAFSRDEKRVTALDAKQGDLEFNRSGMNDGINTLRTDPNAMATANKAWAQRGAGIQASYDSKGGLVLSNSTGPEKMQYTDREGNPTSRYETTQQFAEGKQNAARIKDLGDSMEASRKADEAEAYAAQDRQAQAGLAAAARYEAGKRSTFAGFGSGSVLGGGSTKRRGQDMQLQAQREQNAAALAGHRMQADTSIATNKATNENSLRTTGMNNAVTREGNQMTLDGHLAPIRYQQQTAQLASAISNHVDGGGSTGSGPRGWAEKIKVAMSQGRSDIAEHFMKLQAAETAESTAAQNLGAKAKDNMLAEFNVYDTKDPSKIDGAATQAKTSMVRQVFPGIDSTNEAVRNKGLSDAREMMGIFEKARTQDKVGWEALKFWQPKRPTLSGMPNALGGSTEELSGLGGWTTINGSNGDVLLTKNGVTTNLGPLNERQRELLNTAKKSGWGK